MLHYAKVAELLLKTIKLIDKLHDFIFPLVLEQIHLQGI